MVEIDDPTFEENDPSLYEPSKKRAYTNKRVTIPYKSKIRNLKQYKDMDDETFDAMFEKKQANILPNKQWEERIKLKLDEIAQDYDLSDLKINDKYSLRALAAAILHLDDYDIIVGQIKAKGISDDTIFVLDKISKIQTDIRSDISKIQDDLRISRKSRRSEKQEDAISFIADLKLKAKKYYEQKMMYVFCPKCNTLLATTWFLYPQYKTNVLKVKCHRDLGSGIICDGEAVVTSEWMLNNGMRNKTDIPEAMK